MKIAIASDVHLEFGSLALENTENADVLVLSGDICVASDLKDHDPMGYGVGSLSNRFHDFFKNCSEQFRHVIYVAGNHESYHGDFATTYTILKYKLMHLSNVHILDKECVTIDDVTFIGGTLWTDMNKRDPLTLYHVKGMMNDFNIIKNSNRSVYHTVPLYEKDEAGVYKTDSNGNKIVCGSKKKEEVSRFCPEDSVDDHEKFIQYIRLVTEKEGTYVVVGHHAPSYESIHPMYRHDKIMNGAYYSDLTELMLDRPNIKLWTHGHVHHPFAYMIGDTRVICNPRGYIGHEARAREFKLVYVNV